MKGIGTRLLDIPLPIVKEKLLLDSMYLNAGTGKDCAGQKRASAVPCSFTANPSLSTKLILGATLPTGSSKKRVSIHHYETTDASL